MRKIPVFLSLVLTLSTAHTQTTYMYLCKDASGRTITSDRPIPECADRAVKELDRGGMVRREVPPPLTPEQKREQKLKVEKARADAIAVEEQKQNDHVLLARYATEKDIEAARKRSLDLVHEQIKRDTKEMALVEKTLKAAQAETDAQTKKKVAPSSNLNHRLDDTEQAMQAAKKNIQEHETELVQITLKYDQMLQRYREITNQVSLK